MASLRLFNCALCRQQTFICRSCDRGQIYCNSGCARQARRMAQRAAAHRYQQSYKGKLKNSLRNRCYRERLRLKQQASDTHSKNIVTHQGSLELLFYDVVRLVPLARMPNRMPLKNTAVSHQMNLFRESVCHFCCLVHSDWYRQGFLHRHGVPS